MLRHRIYGSIIFLSRPARRFQFDLALIFYAQTRLERCIAASASTDILSPLKMNTIFYFYFRFRSDAHLCVCRCRKTGNKSRLLRWVLVVRRWMRNNPTDGLAHSQAIKLQSLRHCAYDSSSDLFSSRYIVCHSGLSWLPFRYKTVSFVSISMAKNGIVQPDLDAVRRSEWLSSARAHYSVNVRASYNVRKKEK